MHIEQEGERMVGKCLGTHKVLEPLGADATWQVCLAGRSRAKRRLAPNVLFVCSVLLAGFTWRPIAPGSVPEGKNIARGLVSEGSSASLQQGTGRFNWPSFRGPNASGIADGQKPPTHWNAKTLENVRWKTPIPGLGHSSPIVWGDRVFLTTAVSEDPNSFFRHGPDGRIDRRTDRSMHTWLVYSIDRRSGEIIWAREAHKGAPRIQRHPKNTYASATPATDGQHLVVLFGSQGLYCYDLDGQMLWKRDIGTIDAGASYDVTYQWAAASSPIIYRNLVIVQADQQQGSFIAAYDIETGEQVWQTPRDVISSFSTPTIHEGRVRAELITNGAEKISGYDPLSGRTLWMMNGSSNNTTPTPVVADGLFFITSGYRTRPIFAVRPGATGDISLENGARSNEYVAWSSPRDGPYMVTPIVYGGYLYVVSFNGVLTSFQAKTGERAYQLRLGNVGGAYSASPVAADGRIYFTSEDGEVYVVKPGPEYELLGVNPMGEICLATPAISEGQIFIRTTSHLFAIENGVPATVVPNPTGRQPVTPFPVEMPPGLLPIDDFEDGDLRSMTGDLWLTFTDGTSTAELLAIDGGANGTRTALRLLSNLTEEALPAPRANPMRPELARAQDAPVSYVHAYTAFSGGQSNGFPSRSGHDLSNLDGLRFYARGNGTYQAGIDCQDGIFAGQFETSREWQLIEISTPELSHLVQRGPRSNWTGEGCVGLAFLKEGPDVTGEFRLEIDEVALLGKGGL